MNFTPTLHAIERIKLRFGVTTDKASEWFAQAAKKAAYVKSQVHHGKQQRVYSYEDSYIVVDDKKGVVVTVMISQSNRSGLDDKIRKMVEREVAKASRALRKFERQQEIAKADLLMEAAQLIRNKAHAKSPKIKAIIQTKMTAKQDEIKAVEESIEAQRAEFVKLQKSAGVWTD